MKNDDKKQVWSAAYCAFVSGAVASGKAGTVTDVSRNATKLADRALEDYEQRWAAKGRRKSTGAAEG